MLDNIGPAVTFMFKYGFGLSDEEKLVTCQKQMDIPARKSKGPMDARWLMYEIDHLQRKLSSGYGRAGLAESVYCRDTPLFNMPEKKFKFSGKILTAERLNEISESSD